MLTEIAGYIAFCLGLSTLVPQVLKTVKTKSTGDLSMAMLTLSFFTNFCWMLNGMGTGNTTLMLGTIIASILLIPLIYLKHKQLLKEDAHYIFQRIKEGPDPDKVPLKNNG